MGTIRVIQPGMFTTVQDLGRPGHSSSGVPTGGAADRLALRLGNLVLANPANAAALELTLVGCTIEFRSPAAIALTGADCSTQVIAAGVSRPLNTCTVATLAAGDQLRCGPITRGVRSYLCIRGGINVPLVLGSRSTLPAAGFGGHDGRPLRADDILEFADPETAPSDPARIARTQALHAEHLAALATPIIRTVPGAHADRFSAAARTGLFNAEFTVTPRSDRAGIRVQGPALESPSQGRLPSEGMMHGAIEVPQDGQPIILMPDGPTTGGYPVIAAVIGADLSLLGQLRPLTKVRFVSVTLSEARAALKQQDQQLAGLETM